MFKKGQPVKIPFCNKEGVVEYESWVGNSYLIGVILLKAKDIAIAPTLKWYQVKDLEVVETINQYSSTKHPHAELMLLYAQDAIETAKPWERWDFNVIDSEGYLIGNWLQCQESPMWESKDFVYRRKPKTIRIGNHEVPEPLQELPAGVLIAQVYIVCLHETTGYLTPSFFMSKTLEFQKELIAKQLCHLKKEAAELHAKALLSFTTTEINDD